MCWGAGTADEGFGWNGTSWRCRVRGRSWGFKVSRMGWQEQLEGDDTSQTNLSFHTWFLMSGKNWIKKITFWKYRSLHQTGEIFRALLRNRKARLWRQKTCRQGHKFVVADSENCFCKTPDVTTSDLSVCLKLRDVNFTAVHEMSSYNGPVLSKDFIQDTNHLVSERNAFQVLPVSCRFLRVSDEIKLWPANNL